jgi:uncharacterized protein (DUF1778 family)
MKGRGWSENGSVVIGYQVPNIVDAPAETVRKRVLIQRHGKPGCAGFKIRMSKDDRDMLRAAADCSGWRFDHFCRNALIAAIRKTAKIFGMDRSDLAKLSQSDRAELARRFAIINQAAWSGGSTVWTWTPEKN